jgi:hypothetical protein
MLILIRIGSYVFAERDHIRTVNVYNDVPTSFMYARNVFIQRPTV